MPSTTKIVSVSWFDSCFVDYLTETSRGDDLDGKEGTYTWIVGVERGGQTAEELVEQASDAVYSEEGFPYGDSIMESLKAQLKAQVKEAVGAQPSEWRLWPMDGNGNEIDHTWKCLTCTRTGRDETPPSCPYCLSESDDRHGPQEVEVPEEQPSAWFAVTVEWHPLKISLRNTDDDDGQVMVDCADGVGAADDRYIDGSSWETYNDGSPSAAWTTLSNYPGLVEKLEKEGYDVDQSNYSPPDEEDLRYWRAKCDETNDVAPEDLRATLGWTSLDDVRECRRVSEQFWQLEKAQGAESYESRVSAFVRACWDAGLPLDAERWLRDRK